MWDPQEFNNTEAKFGASIKYSEGIQEFTITSMNLLKKPQEGIYFTVKGNIDKELKLYVPRENLSRFKLICECLNVKYAGKLIPGDYVGKKINLDIKLTDAHMVKISDNVMSFNVKDFNEKMNENCLTFEEIEAKGYEVIKYKRENIVNILKSDESALNDFETGFNIDQQAPF